MKEGWYVEGVDDLSSGTLTPGKPPVCFVEDFRTWCKDHPCDYDLIFHCAAVVGGRLKIEGDPLAVATDLAIDSDFFQWAAKGNPRKIVYFSSSAVYPVCWQRRSEHCMRLDEDMVDFNDNTIGVPDMSYGLSKLVGEYLVKFAVEKYGLDVVIYRPFSGYGHDQPLDYPFPSIVKRVLAGENPVTVWGSGNQTRDFIHIDDAVDAVFATMNVLKAGEALNLGSGVGTSFKQLANAVCRVLDHNVKIVCDPSKPEGVFYRVADVTKLNRFYKPTRTLEWGIQECAKYLDRQTEIVKDAGIRASVA
jgi:nucleoside-diphosphate-sugar epimerase